MSIWLQSIKKNSFKRNAFLVIQRTQHSIRMVKNFGKIPEKPQFVAIEEDVGKFWKDIDAFQESMRQSRAEKRPAYTFYDGPP